MTKSLPLMVLVGVCSALCASGPGNVKPTPPLVQQILPQSWTAGQSVRVTIWGQFLDSARALQFDSDALSGSILDSSFTTATVLVSSTRDAQPGLHALRLVTRRGLSNLFHFRITGWKSVLEIEPNDRPEQAHLVSAQTSVNGMILDTNDSDFYRFHAGKGEVMAFNVFLGRNGYATGGEVGNVTLTLLDSAGRPIGSNFSRFIWDPYLRHTFEREGDYFIVVDHARQAVTCFVNDCENRRLGETYQLTIGRSPMLWSLWPPAARAGTSIESTLAADFLNPGSPLLVSGTGVSAKLAGGDEKTPGRYKVSLKVDAGSQPGLRFLTTADSSGNLVPLSFRVSNGELQMESEPNDTLETSPPLKTPFLLLGRMDHPGDVDSFQFQANEGEALVFQIEARAAGSEMLDPHVAVLSVEGDIVSLNDDGPSFLNPKNRDAKLDLKIPFAPSCAKRSDRFFTQVRDTSKHARDSSFYLLTVRKQSPSFELGLRSERIFLQRGGTTKVPLTLRRLEGFVDEVSISLKGLPEGVTAKPLVVKSTETAAEIELTASGAGPENAREGIYPLDIIGEAQIAGKKVARRATWPNSIPGDGFGYVQIRAEPLRLCIVEQAPFALDQIQPDRNISGGRTILSRGRSGQADLLVKIQRETGFTSPLAFSVEGLPKGLILEKTELTDEDKIARLVVKAVDGSLPLGEYPIAVSGSASVGAARWTEATGTFLLRVEP
ncbi:MAG TPA: hypothetical protein VM120_17485 [Bryobacteraceae bacterium]|nr:hypothetical protein [Bryobacteraceae bacterium]